MTKLAVCSVRMRSQMVAPQLLSWHMLHWLLDAIRIRPCGKHVSSLFSTLSQIDFALVIISATEVIILLPCSLSLYVLFCVLLSLATGSGRCSVRSVRRVCLSCSVCGRE